MFISSDKFANTISFEILLAQKMHSNSYENWSDSMCYLSRTKLSSLIFVRMLATFKSWTVTVAGGQHCLGLWDHAAVFG